MEPEEGMLVLEGSYTKGEGSRWGPRLILKGPLNRRTIDEVINKYRPLTFSPDAEGYEGGASFLIGSKIEAKGFS